MRCFPEPILAFSLPMLLLLSATVRAEDWPRGRGPNCDGLWHETGILQTSPAEGLKVRWRHPVGWGFSSQVEAQGRADHADSEFRPLPTVTSLPAAAEN
jgi:hypothetical protein